MFLYSSQIAQLHNKQQNSKNLNFKKCYPLELEHKIEKIELSVCLSETLRSQSQLNQTGFDLREILFQCTSLLSLRVGTPPPPPIILFRISKMKKEMTVYCFT